MSTVLSNGVIVPDVGSTNWASDLETNWTLLNALIGAVGANVRLDRPNIWTAAQTFSEGIYGDLDGTAAMAVSDANGNEIATTYALKTDVTALATAVSSKAADADVVHLAGAETITGDKTFTGTTATHNITPETNGTYQLGATGLRWTRIFASDSVFVHYQGLSFGTPPTTATYFGLRLNDDSGAVYGDVLAKADPDGHNAIRVRCRNTDGTNTYDRQISLIVQQNGTTQYIPNASGVFDLGRASNKWKTFNGINPGALSLPNIGSARIDISSAITNTSWGTNLYTPPVNGWIAILVSSGCCIIQKNGTYGVSAGSFDSTDIFDQRVFCPVLANQTYEIYVRGTINEASLYPCLGNV